MLDTDGQIPKIGWDISFTPFFYFIHGENFTHPQEIARDHFWPTN